MEKIEETGSSVWMNILNWILDKLNEPSTYVAFFNFLAICGVIVKPELADLIKNVCIAVDALVLFLINENRRQLREARSKLVTLGYEYNSLEKVNGSLRVALDSQKKISDLLQKDNESLQKDNEGLHTELKSLKSNKKKN